MSDIKKDALLALQCIDLTSLTNHETDNDIIQLCQQAKTAYGQTAAICIYPRFIPIAKKTLQAQGSININIATVVNFPNGDSDIDTVIQEITQAIANGADEIDVVFPYKALIKGDTESGKKLIKACKNVCNKKALLKVIIESGELKTDNLIIQASEIAIGAGANFIKTSTGKVSINATPHAAKLMLNVIKNTKKTAGFKAAGGVKTTAEAQEYLTLAREILGETWLKQKNFRFGASSLLTNLLNTLNNNETSITPTDSY